MILRLDGGLPLQTDRQWHEIPVQQLLLLRLQAGAYFQICAHQQVAPFLLELALRFSDLLAGLVDRFASSLTLEISELEFVAQPLKRLLDRRMQ
ncbi:MAG: hypothetical protein ACREQD_09660 [Candidatus Binataceae bacterium]